MKTKVLNLLLVLFSLVGYLEWGEHSSSFLFEVEIVVLKEAFSNLGSIVHPLIILPLLGQVLLAYTAFQIRPNKIVIYLGIGCIALLFGFVFVIGIISSNFKILLSTLPFLLTSIVTIVYHQRKSKVNNE
ncbi:MAG: hypothetical protein P1U56_26635 [Saprospiraceae bacterium]|nr:hypothetical protein [Saprospiraceae bacterium]